MLCDYDQSGSDDNTAILVLIKIDDVIDDTMMTIIMMTMKYILDCLKAFER